MKQVEPTQRFERRAKRRKMNRTLNILIAIVVVLIIVVAYGIIASHATDQSKEDASNKQTEVDDATDQKTNNSNKDKQDDNVVKDNNSVEETTDSVNERVIVPSEANDVTEAFTNPSWEPVGTTQSEPHTTQFDSSSQDWKEMLKAISYATELTEEDFIVWRIENGNRSGVGASKAIGTVQTRDKQYKYRVTIEWVENKGWKPTLVEQLKG